MTEEHQAKLVEHLKQALKYRTDNQPGWIKNLLAEARVLKAFARWIDIAGETYWKKYAELLRYRLKEHPLEGQLALPSDMDILPYHELEKLFNSNPNLSEQIAEQSLEFVPEYCIGALDFLRQEVVDLFSECLQFPQPIRPAESWPEIRNWLIFEAPTHIDEFAISHLLSALSGLTRTRRRKFSVYEVELGFTLRRFSILAESAEQSLRLTSVRHILDKTGESIARRNSLLMAELNGEFSGRAIKSAVRSIKKLLRNLLSVLADISLSQGDLRVAHSNSVLRSSDWNKESEFLIEICRRPFAKLPDGRDSMETRFDSAIRFLRLGFESKSSAVGLLLICSSIEALVGQKSEGVSVTIAENVATVLEPNPEFRADAVAFIKKLYDTRSRVTHGSSKPVTLAELRTMRLVAVVLLHSVFTHRSTLRRLGETEVSIDAFLQQLKRAKYMPGQPLGVMEHTITSLWRKAP